MSILIYIYLIWILWLIFIFVNMISIVWNINVPLSNKWWVSSHIQSIYLSFDCFKENKTISFVPTMVLSRCIFSWKLPMIYWTTVPKMINYIISCYFKINIMDIYFKNFFAFVVIYRFAYILRNDSSRILSLLMVLVLIKVSTVSSSVQSILIFISLIIISHLLFRQWSLSLILLNILIIHST